MKHALARSISLSISRLGHLATAMPTTSSPLWITAQVEQRISFAQYSDVLLLTSSMVVRKASGEVEIDALIASFRICASWNFGQRPVTIGFPAPKAQSAIPPRALHGTPWIAPTISASSQDTTHVCQAPVHRSSAGRAQPTEASIYRLQPWVMNFSMYCSLALVIVIIQTFNAS